MELGGDICKFILFRCDNHSLFQLSKTCRTLRTILYSPRFWLEKCHFEGVALPPREWRKFVAQEENENFNFRIISEKNPYNRNLIRPLQIGDTIETLSQTMKFENDRSEGFILEQSSPTDSSCDPLMFCTGNGWSRKTYEIRLKDHGVEDWVMDKIRPQIVITEMSTCRWRIPAHYRIYVQLLKEDEVFDERHTYNTESNSRFVGTWRKWDMEDAEEPKWSTTAFEFTDYPKGIRKIAILSEGKSNLQCDGHYGASITSTQLFLTFPEEIGYKD